MSSARWFSWLAPLLAAAVLMLPSTARADACDIDEFPLTCSTRGPFYLSNESGVFDGLGSWFTTDEYPDCGVTNDYGEPQDVFVFTCVRSTRVELKVAPTDCDVDLFVLDDSCNPTVPGSCVGHSASAGQGLERVTFDCVEGQIYYISVERPDGEVLDDLCALILDWWLDVCDCTVADDFGYSLTVRCEENCDNRWDDDGDGLEDCLDPDCPTCVETCDDRKDNDYDNLIDCEDPDCAYFDGCCDKDGDDYLAIGGICGGNDCNDNALQNGGLINPGAREIPADGLDQNCDGFEECYVDADGDRWGISILDKTTSLSCLTPGFAPIDGDCDDTDPQVYPERTEIPINDQDDNCDELEECYLDQDGDSYGRNFLFETRVVLCNGAGASKRNDDCDDDNPLVFPGQAEIPFSGFDEDCDGRELCYVDADGDGFGNPDPSKAVLSPFVKCDGPGVSTDPRDCNDTPGIGASIYPGANEGVSDGLDSNCDGLELCYLDEDADTYGNDQGRSGPSPDLTCELVVGFANDKTDCDDSDGTIYPSAPDPAGDGVDQDCNGLQDCYVDADGDTYGSSTIVQSAAPGCRGVNISPVSGDCDDRNIAINPGATEVPVNGIDQDCDGNESCYVDRDDDGFGRDLLIDSVDLTCNVAAFVSTNKRDCNDEPPEGASINPNQVEIPLNGFDDNCDGLESCYRDADADSYGNAAGTLVDSGNTQCVGAGVSSTRNDCNDNDFRINPGATEGVANNLDENCDGNEACWLDADSDGYGNSNGSQSASSVLSCRAPGVSPTANDCDDLNNLIYPGAPTPPGAPGGIDYACSGFTVCYADLDNDDYGGQTQITWADPNCVGQFVSANNQDCNDSNPGIKPGATEIAVDSIDQDCDGFERCFQDLDGDRQGSVVIQLSPDVTCNSAGVSQNDDDCNDNPAANGANIYLGAPELPASGWDENCDGREDCYVDADGDDYGRNQLSSQTDITCRAGATWTDNNLDCNDNNNAVNPGRTETPANGIDEDCDLVDDCYIDEDGDGYGRQGLPPPTVPSPFGLICSGPGVSQNALDCLDIPPEGRFVYPGAAEVPGNGIDDNCDANELCYIDADQDQWGGTATRLSTNLLCLGVGISAQTGDCNETNPAVNPAALETVADTIDQNCDLLEDCYRDQDLDRYGTAVIVSSPSLDCSALGVSVRNDDCYDVPPDGATVYPGAPEIVGNLRDDDCDGTEGCYLDGDGDRYGRNVFAFSQSLTCDQPGFAPVNTDCDDAVAAINPGAAEVPADGVDTNCDFKEDCYVDADSDKFGRATITQSVDLLCLALGVANNDDDCNDVLPGGNFVYPGAQEVPGDGIDQDCNGAETCFVDADRDTWGGTGTTESFAFDCVGPTSTNRGGDCNDANAQVYPTAAELPADGIDQDCNGGDTCWQDVDDDGFGSASIIPSADLLCTGLNEAAQPGDCVDSGTINGVRSKDINPDAEEVCNTVDDDCDGLVDDDDNDTLLSTLWFPDLDGDAYGNTNGAVPACEAPGSTFTTNFGDCDDADPAINPGADEVCDPEDVDEDCDGKADNLDLGSNGITEALGAVPLYPDADGDTYGTNDPTKVVVTCDPGPGLVAVNTDCLDTDGNVNPGKAEVPYNGKDDDCNAATPDDDLDGDGYLSDVNPGGTDCNDNPNTGRNINPGASEGSGLGNGIDDNCNGVVDEGTTWGDDDGDGYSEIGSDCNDANPNVSPGRIELPNGVDDDCDGTIDEGTVRFDDDNDGYTETQGDCNDGDEDVNPGERENCPGPAPECSDGIDNDCDGSVDGGTYDPDGDGYTEVGGDCAEGNAAVYPGAPELPNGIDDDCDEAIDEGTTSFDDDGDGFTELQGDCNDQDEQVYPNATEVPNGVDDDCDGKIDEASPNSDDDGDGFSELQGDCDDANPLRFPGALETANGVDDDCDGETDEGADDLDDDGYTVAEGDCNDANGWANPGQPEVCDQIDNDCDGDIDEGPDSGTSICDDPNVKPPSQSGCNQDGEGCTQGGNGASVALGLLALLTLRRNRRRAA